MPPAQVPGGPGGALPVLWLHRLVRETTPRLARLMRSVGRDREFGLAVVRLERRLREEGLTLGEFREADDLRIAVEGPVAVDLEIHPDPPTVVVTQFRLSGQ